MILALFPAVSAAHEIPNDVTIHVYLKPEDGRMHLLVRVPIEALRDIDFPKRGAGFLDLAKTDPDLRDAAMLWIPTSLELYENDRPLEMPVLTAARVSLPSDRSFESYERAVEHLTSNPLPVDTELQWDQGVLDAAFTYPIHARDGEFSIRPLFSRLGLRVSTILRFLPADGTVRPFEFGREFLPRITRILIRIIRAIRVIRGFRT